MKLTYMAIAVAFAGAISVTAMAQTSVVHPRVAAQWNETLLEIAESEDGFLTLKGIRTTAMMHIAMHDAFNAIRHNYGSYAYHGQETAGSPEAAVAEAAFRVAISQYPEQLARLGQLRAQSAGGDSSDPGIRSGMAVGRAAAQAILKRREGDGWNAEAEYRWHPMAPGVYAEFHEHSGTPLGFIFGASWAQTKGFALQSPDQFRAPPPPAIGGSDYTRAYNEVKEIGRFQSMERTPDQTHLALWWKDFAENSLNRLARDLVLKENLPLAETLRLFALVNMSIFDSYVSSFDNKFFYNHWRPYTAIRWAANDGNPDTQAEVTWTNTHRHTYAFPSYPSAHGMACAAALTAIAEVFGENYAFVMRNPMVDIAGPSSGKIEMHPPTRRFDTFADAATECGLSRVFLGIHFRYDSVEGVKLGRIVGENVITHWLQPRSPSGVPQSH